MKLYYAPGTCSIGIHLLLEEIGAPYEKQKLSFADGEQTKPPFITINPKGKVPTLAANDGSIITEWPAIAVYLARSNAAAKLLPDGIIEETRALEIVSYVVGTMHGTGFARIFRPERFGSDQDAAKAAGREIVDKGFALLDKTLGDRPFAVGSSFSIADAALFYVEFWMAGRLKETLPPNLARHYAKLCERPAVQRTLSQEGFA